MSSPILVRNGKLFDNVNLATDQTSSILDISECAGYSVHSVFSGAPVGTLAVSGSNTQNIADFVAIDTYSITGPGKRLTDVTVANYVYVLITYARNSGTGNLTCTVSNKGK